THGRWLLRLRLPDADAAQCESRLERLGIGRDRGSERRGARPRRRRARRCARACPGARAVCEVRVISFKSPWLLLGLLVLAVAIGLWFLADRRRARYTVRYTNVDVLATVVSGRSWLRYIPSGLVALSLGVLLIGLARPEVKHTVLRERATVIL